MATTAKCTGSLLCTGAPLHMWEMGPDHRWVGLLHGLRPLLLRLPKNLLREAWDPLRGGAGGGQSLPSLFQGKGRSTELGTGPCPAQGLEAKKRSSHCPGGSDGTGSGQEENLSISFPSCSCGGEGPGLRSLNDSFWLSKFNFSFQNDTCASCLKH